MLLTEYLTEHEKSPDEGVSTEGSLDPDLPISYHLLDELTFWIWISGK